MLTAYRRHYGDCQFISMGERRCRCPVWVHGKVKGVFIRKALGTRSWEAAARIVKEWEDDGKEKAVGLPLCDACDRFYADCVARRLSDSSLGKYRLLMEELKREFRGTIGSISIDDLRWYREKWKLAPITIYKKLERLRTFFRFCEDSDWIDSNPAKVLKPPKGRGKPVIPFTPDEIEKIFWATELYPDRKRTRRKQVRAFVLLLRYSGLRIGDAISLRKERLQGTKLFLRTAKTGTAVYIPLPLNVVEALGNVEKPGDYFFWSGIGLLKSAVADWQRTLKKLFVLAGVKGHAHMFRHFFAIDLLSHGVPIEDVAILLGHSSSAITARHYNSFVKSRQIALENAIEKAWKL